MPNEMVGASICSHAIDDYETLRTEHLRGLKRHLDLLEDGLHALRNDSGHVTEEYQTGVIDAMRDGTGTPVDRAEPVGGCECPSWASTLETNSSFLVIVGIEPIDIVDPTTACRFLLSFGMKASQRSSGARAKESLDAAGVGVHGNTVRSPSFSLARSQRISAG